MTTIAILATMDTKSTEVTHLADQVTALGARPLCRPRQSCPARGRSIHLQRCGGWAGPCSPARCPS